jgi:hypothetical protein
LPPGVVGGPFGGDGHSLLFAQVSLAMLTGVAAGGLINGGLGLLIFGNLLGVSDLWGLCFLSGWRPPTRRPWIALQRDSFVGFLRLFYLAAGLLKRHWKGQRLYILQAQACAADCR